ncbi:MAG: hypothetical protein V3S20_00695 [Dehalococcoidia bacterium]
MTWEMLIIATVRVVGSLPVLRWAFLGGIVALLVDQSDLFMMNLIDLGGVTSYQPFDKYLDQVYMLTFLAVALRWEGVTRTIAVALFGYRLVGFFIFEVTGSRDILLFFPNVFEFWFLFVAGLKYFKVDFDYSRTRLAVSGAVLLTAKLFQEYVLHYARWLDGFTSVEAVKAIWEWLTGPIR